MTILLPPTLTRRTVESVTPARLGYMPALDGLRAVAIALVVGTHSIPAFKFGMLGVDVFFVLSGFLITALIATRIETGDFSRRRFYGRRAVRLAPALVITVVMFAPVGIIVMKGEPTLLGAVAALLYLEPLVPLNIFRDTWTLAMEEWFYLLWPLVLAKFFRDKLTMRQAAALIGSLAVAVQLSMVLGPGSIAARPSALLAGSALGLWWLDGGRVPRAAVALGAGLAMLATGAFAGPILLGATPFWMAVAGSVLIVGAVASGATGPAVRFLQLGPLVAIGVVSYEWYLLHDPMLRISHELWGSGSYLAIVPLSLLAAFGLHRVLAPLQSRLRSRLARPTAAVA